VRLVERGKRTVYLRARGTSKANPYHEPTPVWGDPVAIRACVQPMSGGLEASAYGQRVADMRLMLYAGIAAIREADGVCVDVPGGAEPDYKVVSVQAWSGHRRIAIERTAIGGVERHD